MNTLLGKWGWVVLLELGGNVQKESMMIMNITAIIDLEKQDVGLVWV